MSGKYAMPCVHCGKRFVSPQLLEALKEPAKACRTCGHTPPDPEVDHMVFGGDDATCPYCGGTNYLGLAVEACGETTP